MFSVDHIKTSNDNITLDIVRARVSEYDIFKKYCKTFNEINIGFTSDLYEDNNPSCYIYQDKNNRLKYKDFGTGDSFDCFSYVMKKYNCTFKESLRIIASDFNLIINTDKLPTEYIIGVNHIPHSKPKEKPIISIIPRNWNIVDYNYWYNKYGLTFNDLNEFNVIPLSYCYLNKGNKTIVFEYNKSNPMYAYRFEYDGKYFYKVYWPLSKDKKRKWLFNGFKENIEGYDNLPLNGNTLIITKSLKDIIVLKKIGYSSISLQGEGNKLSQTLFCEISKRFNNILIFYDNDESGIKNSKSISLQYGLKSIVLPDEYLPCKDTSDLVESIGLVESKKIIDNLING